MRATSIVLLVALTILPLAATQAMPVSEGKIVQGRYEASGRASTAGVTVTYRASSVRVTNHGRIFGRVQRKVSSRGKVLQSNAVKIFGKIRPVRVRVRKNTFTALAVVRIADGAVFKGEFTGLADPSQRVSRFFRGKISGNKNSNLLLRSR